MKPSIRLTGSLLDGVGRGTGIIAMLPNQQIPVDDLCNPHALFKDL